MELNGLTVFPIHGGFPLSDRVIMFIAASLKHQHRPCDLPLVHIIESFVEFV